ncbi:ethanolamine-phosphate phospho-lyase [Hyalella azteca]|uniref:Ethanolamine-phosphate phospho-lyase n=1 Tax=Hyalella azteca TaxID=294128 RepID=A0A8B7NFJ2_HYAAZ|nr:ethanolamine-phosphate phospho-lyase [Hyalella azteca]
MASLEKIPKEKTIELRQKYVGPSCKLFFRSDPLKIVRASGCRMYDELGNAYLDCINNVAHVGHCHPKVVAAAAAQYGLLNTNNRFLHDELVLYAQRLCSLFAPPLCVVYFTNSGSEANDLALRLAWTHTRHRDVITLDHAYHGHVSSLIDISPYKFNHPGGEGKKDWVHVSDSIVIQTTVIGIVITVFRAIAESFGATGMEYFNTFGGNAVSCAVARAVLDVIEEDGLMTAALNTGRLLGDLLRRLMDKHQIIGDVRGMGLFWGVDLVTCRETRAPATAHAAHVINRLKEQYVLLSSDGPHRNVLKFKSPLVFSEDDVREVVNKLDVVLTEITTAEALVNDVARLACNGGSVEGNGTSDPVDSSVASSVSSSVAS